MLEEESCT